MVILSYIETDFRQGRLELYITTGVDLRLLCRHAAAAAAVCVNMCSREDVQCTKIQDIGYRYMIYGIHGYRI